MNADVSDDLIEIDDPEIDVQKIMEEIRRRIERRRAELGPETRTFPRFGAAAYPGEPEDGTADPDLHHHLRLLNQTFTEFETSPTLAPSPATRVPILGRIWKLIRGGAHNLVLFYVNRAITHQTNVNRHLVSVVNRLTDLVQTQQRQIAALEAELEALRRTVDVYEERADG